MRGCQIHSWRTAFVVSLREPAGAKAPMIARLQSDKAELGARGRQVVADILRKREELGRHHRANGVAALILCAGVALAVSKEPGQGLKRAGRQRFTQNIDGRILLHLARLA